MKLYIQVENGQPVNHPAIEDNLIHALGNIPANWESFTRVEKPVAGVYQTFDSDQPTYKKVDGVWADVWLLRDMTDEEKAVKQQSVKDAWAARDQADNWSVWTFDELLCTFVPPIPRPAAIEGVNVFWCGADANWKEVPVRPVDDNQYKFDFSTWTWVAV